MSAWKPGRGRLGPMTPLLGAWTSEPAGEGPASAAPCRRVYTPHGKDWIRLEAEWGGPMSGYREIALFGAPDGVLSFWSFVTDGKRSEGVVADGSDVHPLAVAFIAQMPAGKARMIHWPDETGEGWYFAVESQTKAGWNRFFRHRYRPEAP